MSSPRQHTFPTPGPVRLFVEIGRGRVHLTAAEPLELVAAAGVAQATVEVAGSGAEEVSVEHDGDAISIVAPRQRVGFFGGEPDLRVTATVPAGSEVWTRTGSADVEASGRWGALQVRTGSGTVAVGTVEGAASVETGSGEIRVACVTEELRVKSGSGDIAVSEASGATSISTGSGDVSLEHVAGPVVVKTGSGDLRVAIADGDVTVSTASGDTVVERVNRGRFGLKAASGDAVIGVPRGIPVWTDLSSVTGDLRSSLDGAGPPEDGQEHVELRVETVSGDITLRPL